MRCRLGVSVLPIGAGILKTVPELSWLGRIMQRAKAIGCNSLFKLSSEVSSEQIFRVVSRTSISNRRNDGEFHSGTDESRYGCVDDMDEEQPKCSRGHGGTVGQDKTGHRSGCFERQE